MNFPRARSYRGFGCDDLFIRLGICLQPAVQRISEQIDNYSIEEIQAIAAAALSSCRKDALEMKGRGWTDEKVVDCIAGTLAYPLVVEPMKPEIIEVMRVLPNEDPETAAYITKAPAKAFYGNRLMQLQLRHKYGDPLKEKMKERLRPFVEEALAPFFAEMNRPAASWTSIFSWLLPL